jgi:hypothetical protein
MGQTKKTLVLYVRSQLATTDGRLMRYLAFMQQHQITCRAFCWDRTGATVNKAAEHFDIEHFAMPARTGGRYLNAWKLIRWNLAVFGYCVRHRAQIRKIHCADFDSVLPCFLFSKLFNRPLIFDSYDRYSDSRSMTNPLKYLVDQMETYILQKAAAAILPSVCRIEQYQLTSTDNLRIIENVPLFNQSALSFTAEHQSLSTVLQQVKQNRPDYRAVLSYVGILEPEIRGLEHLISCVAALPDLALIVAGAGPLHEQMKEAAAVYPNIFFVGSLDYIFAEQLMAATDLHIGLYYSANPNHKYASPNKYYEHLYFGKALLTSEGTPPGQMVQTAATGFAVADNKEALLDFLTTMTTEQLKMAGQKAAALWQQHYANYHTEVFATTYAPLVRD